MTQNTKPTNAKFPTLQQKSVRQLLGYYHEQRASAFMAGARAILIKKPVTKALATTYGRMLARTLGYLGVDERVMNYVRFRPYGMMERVRRAVKGIDNPVLIDPFHGYAPHWVWLAQEMPQLKVIAFDLPDIIQDIQKRLNGIKHFTMPPNIHWIGTNLGEHPIHEHLHGEKADAIVAVGSYIPYSDYRILLDYLKTQVKPGGAILGVFPWEPAVHELSALNNNMTRIFAKQVGKLPGLVRTKEQAIHFFKEQGLHDVTASTITELATEMNHPPPISLELWVTGRV